MLARSRRWLRSRVRSALSRALQNDAVVQMLQDIQRRPLIYGDPTRLIVDPLAAVDNPLVNVNSGQVIIGPWAAVSQNVMLLAGGGHDIDSTHAARHAYADNGYDIIIEEGAWIAAGARIIGPCVVGAHAVVAAGSLVIGDVEPHTLVAGSPAKLIRNLGTADR